MYFMSDMKNYTLTFLTIDNPIYISENVFNSFLDINKNPKRPEYLKRNGENIEIKNEFFSEIKRVPDVCRYTFEITNNHYKIELKKGNIQDRLQQSNFSDYNIDNYSENPSIVIILESPHKDEYTIDFIPKAPAQGETGMQMCLKLEKILSNNDLLNFKDNKYNIYIVNPIPFQTSLHFLHGQAVSKKLNNESKKEYETLRDDVWKKIWIIESIKKDFTKRIKLYNPEIIINACTKGVTDCIEKKLLKNFANKKYFKICHPSSWSYRKSNYMLKKN